MQWRIKGDKLSAISRGFGDDQSRGEEDNASLVDEETVIHGDQVICRLQRFLGGSGVPGEGRFLV